MTDTTPPATPVAVKNTVTLHIVAGRKFTNTDRFGGVPRPAVTPGTTPLFISYETNITELRRRVESITGHRTPHRHHTHSTP